LADSPQLALGTLPDLAEMAELGSPPRERVFPRLPQPFGMTLADEHF